MKKKVSKKYLDKAKSILGNYFGTVPIDKLELLLEQPGRLFKNKLSVFYGDTVPKKYRTKHKISDWKLEEKAKKDLEDYV